MQRLASIRVLLPLAAVIAIVGSHVWLWRQYWRFYDAKTISLAVAGTLAFIAAAVRIERRHVTRLVCAMSGVAIAVSYGITDGRFLDLFDSVESLAAWVVGGAFAGLIASYTSFGDRVRLGLLWADENPMRWRALGFSAITFCTIGAASLVFEPVGTIVWEASSILIRVSDWLPRWLVNAAITAPIFVGAIIALPMVIVVAVVGSDQAAGASQPNANRARRFDVEY